MFSSTRKECPCVESGNEVRLNKFQICTNIVFNTKLKDLKSTVEDRRLKCPLFVSGVSSYRLRCHFERKDQHIGLESVPDERLLNPNRRS